MVVVIVGGHGFGEFWDFGELGFGFLERKGEMGMGK